MASLSDVAKAAGVSLTTASLVLNRPKQPNRVSEGCSERVRAVAKRLGYVPNYHARSMKLRRAETIAVALDVGDGDGDGRTSELADAYFNQLIGGIETHLRQVGYQMTLIMPHKGGSAAARGVEGIGQRRFDGMIVLAVAVDPAKPHALGELPPEAAVVAIEYAGRTAAPVVHYDERHGVDLAVGHLAGLGHERLLWVAPEGDGRSAVFRAVARRLGVEATPLHFGLNWEHCRGMRFMLVEQARGAMREYLRREGTAGFTGIVAYNDPVAIGVCGALAEAGVRVPADVSVVGFDDVEASFCIPPLTTVSHKLAEMGRRAAERVMEMIREEGDRGKFVGVRDVLKPELVVRGSTGKVRMTKPE